MMSDLELEFIDWLDEEESYDESLDWGGVGLRDGAPQSAIDAYKEYWASIKEFDEENERREKRGEPILARPM